MEEGGGAKLTGGSRGEGGLFERLREGRKGRKSEWNEGNF